jgi:hypothetical protein
MILDFLNEETSQIQNDVFGQDALAPHENYEEGHSIIHSSGDVAGIEIRMLPPLVRNNHTIKFWPFPGRARLYCLTLVVSDASNQLTGLMELNAFPRIGDGDLLPINKTIYYWQEDESGIAKPPSQVHVMCSIIKSKEALRETADVLASVKDDEGYKSIVGELSSVLSNAASLTTVTSLTMQAAHIVGRYLGKVDDQPIGTVVNSFTRLHGDWDRLGINPVTVRTRDVDFSFELIIRDQYRQQMAQSGTLILPASYQSSPEGIDQMVRM